MTSNHHLPRRKPLVFVASSRKDLQRMPEGVQDSFGFKLDRAQIGRHPVGSRPYGEGLPAGILKLIADDGGETYRAAYVVELAGVVYVLDVFQKKSKSGTKTPRADKERVRQRDQWAKQHYELNRQRYLNDAGVAAAVPGASRRRRDHR